MKIKKTSLYAALFVIFVIAAAVFYFMVFQPKKHAVNANQGLQGNGTVLWLVDKNGYLYYPAGRGMLNFARENFSETKDLLISKVVYQSTRGNIYGLLVLPRSAAGLLPGVVLLPGAGVSKESELALAEKIAELGAAVLTIDQRGVGETDGYFPSLDEDYKSFVNSKEPYQHLMVYDALRGYDLLFSAPFVDPDRIIIAGESLGGRVAVIAAAIDRHVTGVLVISSTGIGFTKGNDTMKDAFIKSIDMDHYVSLITPRKIVMIQNLNDRIVPFQAAANSYAKAQVPKRFYLVNDTTCNHGYCDSMYGSMVDGLNYLIGLNAPSQNVNGTKAILEVNG